MFKFTKKAEIEEQIELTDEQLSEVTGGGLVSGLLGGGTAKAGTSAATGTSVQLGVQTAVGAAISTDALSSTGIVGGLL